MTKNNNNISLGCFCYQPLSGSSNLWIQSPVKKKTQTKEISFFLCGKCKHSFLYYFLLHSWQHCINREDREFKSVSDGLRPLESLCSVRLHHKFCLHYLVFTFHKPVCLFQRHCRAERLSCQSRLCEAWRLRPVEVHRGRRILQG